jgi:hypothetical protein
MVSAVDPWRASRRVVLRRMAAGCASGRAGGRLDDGDARPPSRLELPERPAATSWRRTCPGVRSPTYVVEEAGRRRSPGAYRPRGE